MTAPPITLDQLEDGHALILGTTGSGKTYQLRGLLEQLRRADRRVGAIDKLGNHWGLTLAADGKAAGLEFVIFGGKRAHVPMAPGDGARLGRLFIDKNIPAIFDVSQWHGDDQQRWVADFADAVFTLNDEALHLAMDEAQSWVPQGGGGEAFRSVQRLAEQGRGNGLRLLLTCQRLSRLDATVRGMMHTVVAMRQTSTIDRKAVADLIATDKVDLRLLDELPKLKTGTGYLWRPTETGLEPITFPRNATFDSSRTPKHGDKAPAPIAVSSALVEELKALLAPAKSPSEAPVGGQGTSNAGAFAIAVREYERRIDELKADNARLERIAVMMHREGFQQCLHAMKAAIAEIEPNAEDSIGSQAKPGAETAAHDEAAAVELGSRPAAGRSAAAGAEIMAPPKPSAARKRAPAAEGQHPLAKRIVDLLDSLAPARFTWKQVATLLGYSPNGGHFRGGKRDAIATGKIAEDGDYVRSTTEAAGLSRAKAYALWEAVLPNPAPAIMELLREVGALEVAKLAALLGYEPTGGHFRSGLKHLRQNHVIHETGKTVRLADPLPAQGDS